MKQIESILDLESLEIGSVIFFPQSATHKLFGTYEEKKVKTKLFSKNRYIELSISHPITLPIPAITSEDEIIQVYRAFINEYVFSRKTLELNIEEDKFLMPIYIIGQDNT